jgi:hypothetical protein
MRAAIGHQVRVHADRPGPVRSAPVSEVRDRGGGRHRPPVSEARPADGFDLQHGQAIVGRAFNEGDIMPKLDTTNGRPVNEVVAGQTNETGQHEGYIVLAEEERAKGFVRPYRDSYRHSKCGTITTMGRALSETYARDPKFYGSTFCCQCNRHFPVDEFVWTADGQQVGS